MLLDEQGIPRLVQNIRAIPRPDSTSLLVVHLFNGRTVTVMVNNTADAVNRNLHEHSQYAYEWWESVVAERVFPMLGEAHEGRAGQYH